MGPMQLERWASLYRCQARNNSIRTLGDPSDYSPWAAPASHGGPSSIGDARPSLWNIQRQKTQEAPEASDLTYEEGAEPQGTFIKSSWALLTRAGKMSSHSQKTKEASGSTSHVGENLLQSQLSPHILLTQEAQTNL